MAAHLAPLLSQVARTSDPGVGAFQTDSGTAWNAAANDSYGRLDDVPGAGGTDHVKQTASDSTHYLQYNMTDTTKDCIQAASGIISYESSGAGTLTAGTYLRDTADRTIYTGNMKVGATRTYKSGIISPAGGYWTQTQFNNITAQIGYAAMGGGTAPVPYWHSVMVEYAWR
jgi:hypothetical protein